MMMSNAARRFGDPLSLEALVEAALAEDLGPGDVTSEWTVPSGAAGQAVIVSKASGVVAGVEAAAAVFRRLDPDLQVVPERGEGDGVEPGDLVLTVSGSLASILGAERTALNFLGRLSGIATSARRFADAIEGTGCRVLDTRKTTPGWRALEKRAAAAGGAVNHRTGLYDMVLIKENHIRAAGGIRTALEGALGPAREAGIEVEIEVTGFGELEQALAGNARGERPQRILLDNMTMEELERCVRRVSGAEGPRPRLEASGGVTLDTVRRIAETGVDFISAGAITHSAPALDLSLQVRQA
jgi:nicotinate-nucleotide pyrophosphorylase (carboxylating)